jgi:hypothetical protein
VSAQARGQARFGVDQPEGGRPTQKAGGKATGAYEKPLDEGVSHF